MSEETKVEAKAIELRPVENINALEKIPQDQRHIRTFKDVANSRKFETYMLIPKDEDEAQGRYGCGVITLCKKGVMQGSYGTNDDVTDAIIADPNTSEQEKADALQAVVDELSFAPREKKARVPSQVKANAKRATSFDEIAQKAGFKTNEEYVAYLVANQKKSK